MGGSRVRPKFKAATVQDKAGVVFRFEHPANNYFLRGAFTTCNDGDRDEEDGEH